MDRIATGRLLTTILLLWCSAAVTYTTLRLTYGARPASVKVRWAASISEVDRAGLERKYALIARESGDERTWNYLLTDVSRANIRAIVHDPAVEDTHEIDRRTFQPIAAATQPAYVGPGPPWIGLLLERLSYALFSLGTLAAAVLVLSRVERPALLHRPVAFLATLFTSPHAIVALLRALARAVAARVPEASAEAVAVYRIVFGAACIWLLGSGLDSQWVDTAQSDSGLQRLMLSAFAPVPAAVDWIRPWIIVWALLFIAGAWARFSYVMLVAGGIAWAALYTPRFGTHPIAAPLLAMICLAWSRWGDAWSVDGWWQRRRGRTPLTERAVPRAIYGYTMWVPGLVMTTCFAAAAIAKLRESGVDWITNGTVKYHFLTDADQAWVDWGLRLAQHEWAAVLMSFGAIALEATVIVGVFSRRYRYRAAAGMGCLALLLGFALFQGVVWPLWWLMLLSFLPWHRLGPRPTHPSESPSSPPVPYTRMQLAQLVVVLVVIAQQIAVSAARVEHAPLLSIWDMYATTYTGPQDYESKSGLTYMLVGRFDDGTSRGCKIGGTEAAALIEGSVSRTSKRVLSTCFTSTSSLRSVRIEGRRRPVDWSRWAFGEEKTVTVSQPIAVNLAR